MMTNEELYKHAEDAILDLHNDKSVSIEDAIINLETLKDEMDILIEGLKYSL